MAVRRPVWFNTITNSITDMTNAQIEDIQVRAVWAWSFNPSKILSVVNSNGNLDAMEDTYREAGAGATNTRTYPDAPAGQDVTVTWDVINFTADTLINTTAPADTNNRRFPLYRDSDDNLRSMTQQDFFDTFIDDAIGMLVEEDVGNTQAGTYEISGTDSISGYDYIGEVFVDQYPNVSAYDSAGIPEDLAQTFSTSYGLHVRNWVGDPPDISAVPLVLTNAGHIKEVSISPDGLNYSVPSNMADFDVLLQDAMRNQARSGVGNRIAYNIEEEDANGNLPTGYTPRGSAMVNTNTTETIDRIRFVNANDYRSQEHPSGTPTTQNTYYLTIRRY